MNVEPPAGDPGRRRQIGEATSLLRQALAILDRNDAVLAATYVAHACDILNVELNPDG